MAAWEEPRYVAEELSFLGLNSVGELVDNEEEAARRAAIPPPPTWDELRSRELKH